MVIGGLRTAITFGLAGLATAQAAVIATLMIADRRRRRGRQHVGFPTAPPQTMPADETVVTVYTKGRDLYDDMIAAIDAAEDTVLLETYIWKGDRTGQRFKRAVTAAADRGVDVYLVYDWFANLVVAQMLFLESENPEKDIQFYINSPGGVVSAGLAIYDTMQFVKPAISTMCIGQACSAASLLLMAGTHGKRFALPNSRVMIHQPSGGAQGQATDIEIHAKEILYLRGRLNDIYAKHTGKTVEQVSHDMERDRFMSAEEARDYGLIDTVFERRADDSVKSA